MQPLMIVVMLVIPVLAPSLAFAHGAESGSTLWMWTWEPGVVAALAVAAALYAAGARALAARRRFTAVAGWRASLFAMALATIAVALDSPIDALANDLFSAHMVQHLILILVAPPLLVLSRPTAVALWALPAGIRRAVLRSWRRGWLGRSAAVAFNPVVAWVAFIAAFAFWHLPGPYRWAIESPALHALEHLSFVATSLMFWTVVLEPEPRRLSYGATLVFVVTTAVLSGLPGALMLLAPRAIYAVHSGALPWGLTPLQDQQLAGVVMWVPMGLVYVGVAAWAFWRWLQEAERRTQQRESVGAKSLGAKLPHGESAKGKPARRELAQAKTARGVTVAMLPLIAVALARCDESPASSQPVPGGDATRGAALIAQVGCGGCHVVPGVPNSRGMVGPPLTAFGGRLYVAGMVPNTPDNLISWLKNPQAIVPGNVMPALGLDDQQARDIAAYLYTLR